MDDQLQRVLSYLDAHEERFLRELFELLRIPSISALPERREDVRRAAEWLAAQLSRIGLEHVGVLPTGGHPVVYGDWLHQPDRPTVLVYGHYDVQPVDPLDEWERPPFEPTLQDGRIYARGAADDKGQLFLHVKALEAYLAALGRLPLNVRLLFEGEEEIGSANLDPFIAANRALLQADLAVISDTAMYARGQPAITYGLRGLAYLQVDVRGARHDLHSGSFGGAVRNPAQVLAELIASLKDPEGRVRVAGFYDDVLPLSAEERAEIARLPFDEQAYCASIGVKALWGEPGYSVLERVWARPTLDVNGIWGGFAGAGSKTIIPAQAGAKLSCRLVPNQDPDRIAELVERHLLAHAPPEVTVTVTRMHGGKPVLTPLDHPAVRAAARALEAAYGVRPVFMREGGSIPVVATLQELLGLPTVLLGFGLPDEGAHAPNERFELENFRGGLRTIAHYWALLPAALAGAP